MFFWKEGGTPKVLIDLESEKIGSLGSIRQLDNQPVLFFDHASFPWKDNGMVPFGIGGIQLPSPSVLIDKIPGSGEYYFLGPDYMANGPDPDRWKWWIKVFRK